MIFIFNKVENILGKGENAGYHYVIESILQSLLNSGFCGKGFFWH